MKTDIPKMISETAQQTAAAMLKYRREVNRTNHYRVMERLLFGYKGMAQRMADHEQYVMPVERSKSITIAPGGGGQFMDHEDRLDAAVQAREVSYQRTLAQFDELDAIVQQFVQDERMIVIRMYYFNENSTGHDRGGDAKRYTLEEIAVELDKHERTVRRWRASLVEDMVVQMFGVDGALSIEAHQLERREAMKDLTTVKEQ